MKMQSLSSISHSPSFNSYSSSDKLTQIAARVVQSDNNNDTYDSEQLITNNNQQEDDVEGEFEFSFASGLSPIPADEIFHNGQIRPVYPLFNTELVFANEAQVRNDSVVSGTIPKASSSARLPLGKLFLEERDRDNSASSCSSSESDELDGVPAETYCVWEPKTGDNPRELRKKSNSTGTSKRWKFRDLLHKSSSDGKDTFAFLTVKRDGSSDKELEASKIAGSSKETAAAPPRHYVRKENNRSRTYLPYKKDLVGLFSNVNGVHSFRSTAG